MCDKCQKLYDSYSALCGKLNIALEKTDDCKVLAGTAQGTFSEIIISGATIDKGDIINILKKLDIIVQNLESMIKQCVAKMSEIESSCPGPDHYNSKWKAEKRHFS